MECLEFRQLLHLLKPDLKEFDIPHCTKLCESIIVAWRTYFLILKHDLVVSIQLLVILQSVSSPFRMRKAKSHSHLTYGQMGLHSSACTWPLLLIGLLDEMGLGYLS
jgi:hypothetical protein